MTTELDERLADLRRPARWSADEHLDVLDQILASDPTPRRTDHRLVITRPNRRRRTITLAAAAGLAVAGSIAIPAALPNSADQAAAVEALHRLAHVAAVSPSDHLGPTQYLHIVDVEHQNATPGQSPDDSRYEYWIRADGLTFERINERSGSAPARKEVWRIPPGPLPIDGMTAPQYLDRLPTDPAALESYVRAHSEGSTSSDERVFVAVADIVRRGLAGADLRSAAIEVLARLGHVRLGDESRDSLGHPVEAFDFVDPHGRPHEIQTIMFDTRTAQITEERDYLDGKLFFSRTVRSFGVVNTVPANIRRSAVPQK
jgi:hypothetical protein